METLTMPRPVVLITGGSRGIGAAAARRFAQGGWDVAVGYRRSREQAEALVRALEGTDELALFEASLLLEKAPKEELPRLLDQLYLQLGERLAVSGEKSRLLKAAALVRKLRGAAELNANPGQLSGWLCAGMFLENEKGRMQNAE